jgi:phosphatidylinositol phospholipase C, delta
MGTALKEAKKGVKEKAKETSEHVKNLINEKTGHHQRIPSIQSDNASTEDLADTSAIDSTIIGEPLQKSASSHGRGSRHSSTSNVRPEPRVLHGWTLTSEVPFRDVCKTIRETAFLTTPLPIIVSLEVHADLEQQEIMVQIMKEEWKGYLVDEAHESCKPEERLPRLSDLLNKILVKVKKATTPPGSLKPGASSASLSPSSTSSTLAPAKFDHADSASGSDDDRGGKSKKKKTKICESLSELGIYTHSAHFMSFDQEEALHPPHVFSISEDRILELHNTKQMELFTHNRKYFMRAYPAGRRIDSSNPDPSMFWRRGVQMVALNWQSWDEGTMVNEAMFAGENGWVLKPEAYRSQDSTSEPVPSISRQTINFRITILAGQQIPLPLNHPKGETFHPLVKCELHVDKPDGPIIEGFGRTKEGKYKLATKHKKTENPDWGPAGTVLNFIDVQNVIEDLCFLRLVSLPISLITHQ